MHTDSIKIIKNVLEFIICLDKMHKNMNKSQKRAMVIKGNYRMGNYIFPEVRKALIQTPTHQIFCKH